MGSLRGRAPTGPREAPEGRASPSRFAIAGHPVHPMIVPFPIAFLVGAFVTDIAFAITRAEFFAQMSAWLLGAGIVTTLVAAVPGLVDWWSSQRARRVTAGKVHAWGNGGVLAIAVINAGLRVGGDHPAILVPWGLALSAVTALGLAITGWAGGELSYRHLIGVNPHPDLTAEQRDTAG